MTDYKRVYTGMRDNNSRERVSNSAAAVVHSQGAKASNWTSRRGVKDLCGEAEVKAASSTTSRAIVEPIWMGEQDPDESPG